MKLNTTLMVRFVDEDLVQCGIVFCKRSLSLRANDHSQYLYPTHSACIRYTYLRIKLYWGHLRVLKVFLILWPCLKFGLFVCFSKATFCGSSLGKRAGYHFNTVDFESMGYHLCDTLLDYCDPDDSKVCRCFDFQLNGIEMK